MYPKNMYVLQYLWYLTENRGEADRNGEEKKKKDKELGVFKAGEVHDISM